MGDISPFEMKDTWVGCFLMVFVYIPLGKPVLNMPLTSILALSKLNKTKPTEEYHERIYAKACKRLGRRRCLGGLAISGPFVWRLGGCSYWVYFDKMR